MRRSLLAACAVIAVSFMCVSSAGAWCIYNMTDQLLYFAQWDGAADSTLHPQPKGDIDKGEKHCCNWKTEDCNTGGKRTSKVSFDVQVHKGKFNKEAYFVCSGFKIKAGGWLTVRGKGRNAKCEAHFSD